MLYVIDINILIVTPRAALATIVKILAALYGRNQEAPGPYNDHVKLPRNHLEEPVASVDAERSVEEFIRLSGRGHSDAWNFDREGIHERSMTTDDRR